MAGKLADMNGEVEPIAADTKRSLLSLSSNQPFPTHYRPPRPPRSIKIPKTKPARGLEEFDPFNSMHYDECPRFTTQELFDDDDEEQARVPTN